MSTILNISSEANHGLICPIDEVVKSPVLTHYRNKCEFTIGHDFDGKRTIGFLLGLYREGVTVVLGVEECVHIPEKAKAVVKHFQVCILINKKKKKKEKRKRNSL